MSGMASGVNLATIKDNTVKTIDASGLGGGLTVKLNNNTGIQVKGGQGNDKITTGAAIGDTAYLDAGAGTADTLIVTDSGHVTSSNGSLYNNFEVLQVEDRVSVNLDHLAATNSIGAVIINQGGNDTGVTNMTAAQAANVTVIKGTGNGTITFGVKGAATPGQIDLLKITVDDGTPTVQNVTLDAPVVAGVEKLELTAKENVTITELTSGTALNGVKFFRAGNVSVTTGAVDFAANTIFDFSAVTGTVTFDASGAQSGAAATGMLIKGSATKTNTVQDSQKADIVILGSGNDSVTFSGGADTVTLGAGRDTFNFNNVKGSNGMGTTGVYVHLCLH